MFIFWWSVVSEYCLHVRIHRFERLFGSSSKNWAFVTKINRQDHQGSPSHSASRYFITFFRFVDRSSSGKNQVIFSGLKQKCSFCYTFLKVIKSIITFRSNARLSFLILIASWLVFWIKYPDSIKFNYKNPSFAKNHKKGKKKMVESWYGNSSSGVVLLARNWQTDTFFPTSL